MSKLAQSVQEAVDNLDETTKASSSAEGAGKKMAKRAKKEKAAKVTNGSGDPLTGLAKKVKSKKLQVNTEDGRAVILTALTAAVDGEKCHALSAEHIVAAKRLIAQLNART